jgi:hypothetical protein
VRVGRRRLEGVPLVLGDEAAQLLGDLAPLAGPAVKHTRHRAPARVAREHLLLVGRRRPAGGLQVTEQADGGEVATGSLVERADGHVLIRIEAVVVVALATRPRVAVEG